MNFEAQPRLWLSDARYRLALLLTGSLVLFGFAFIAGRMGYEPYWLFAGAAAAVVIPVIIRKFPVALIVALSYVGQFKSKSAVGFSLTDPTFITLTLLYGAVAVELMLVATGTDQITLRDLFRGQALGVSAFFLLILVIAMSYTYTPAPGVGGDKIVKLIVFDSMAFVAPLILLRNGKDVSQLVMFTTVASVAVAFLTVHRLMYPTAALLSGDQDATQIGSGLMMDAAVLILLYYPTKPKWSLRTGAMLCLMVLSLGIAASLSRSAILALLAVATVGSLFLGLNSRVASRRTILIAAAACLIVPSVAFLWFSHLPAASSKFASKAQELVMIVHGSAPSGTVEQRVQFTGSAWRAFLAKPLMGWGAGGWSTLWHYSESRVVVTYPHNFILEIAAEQGLAGLVPLAILLFAIFRACGTVLRSQAGRLTFIVPVVALSLIGNCVTGQVESRDVWAWCGILFALARMAELQLWPDFGRGVEA